MTGVRNDILTAAWKSHVTKKFFIYSPIWLRTILLSRQWTKDSIYVLRFEIEHREGGQKIERTFVRDKQTDKHRSLSYRCTYLVFCKVPFPFLCTLQVWSKSFMTKLQKSLESKKSLIQPVNFPGNGTGATQKSHKNKILFWKGSFRNRIYSRQLGEHSTS